jgi:hypothetical protein
MEYWAVQQLLTAFLSIWQVPLENNQVITMFFFALINTLLLGSETTYALKGTRVGEFVPLFFSNIRDHLVH